MKDITSETVLPLFEAPYHIPLFREKKVHYSTLYRWWKKGARGRKLEVFHRGGRVFTSVEAINRFFMGPAQTPAGPFLEQRTDSIARAEAMLDAEGL